MGIARGKGEFIGTRCHNARSAMRSLDISPCLENREVSAYCRNGGIHLTGNLLKCCKLNLLQIFPDKMLALFRLHPRMNMEYFERFCKIYLTNFQNLSKSVSKC